MRYQRHLAEAASLFLVFVALVFPTDPAASIVRFLALPGRAYEWTLMLVLLVTLASLFLADDRIAEPRVVATGVAVLGWGLFVAWLSALRDTASPLFIVAGVMPYVFWLAMLLPGCAGALPSWNRLLGTMMLSTLTGAVVGAVALFFSPGLLAFLIQRKPEDLAAYYELSFRLPLGSGYLLPFLILACFRMVVYGAGRWSRLLATMGIVTFTGVLLATQSRTLIGITVVAGLWIGFPDIVRSRRGLVTAVGAFGIAMLLVAGGLARMDPQLRGILAQRFGMLVTNPSTFFADAYVGNRDYLYSYSGESLELNPLVGRGLGTVIPRPGGGYAAMQDVTVLNHIDKSGLIGLALFIVLICFTYYWMRRALEPGPEAFHSRLEYELRRLFVQYYPFILLTCLNVDMLYEDSFVLLNAVAVGSLMVEGFARARPAMRVR